MRKHTDWLEAALQQIPALTGRVYVSLAVNATGVAVKPPYAVIHPSDGSDQSDRLAGPAVVQHPRWVIHSAGLTYKQAQDAAEAIKAKLIVGGLGIIPTISGEQAERFWYESPQPIQTDTDASPPYLYHTAEVGFKSTPV